MVYGVRGNPKSVFANHGKNWSPGNRLLDDLLVRETDLNLVLDSTRFGYELRNKL